MLVEEVPLCFRSSKVEAFLVLLKGKLLLCISFCPSQVTFGSVCGEIQMPPNQRFPHVKKKVFFFFKFSRSFQGVWDILGRVKIT